MMPILTRKNCNALLFSLLLCPVAWAGTLVDISAEAMQEAPNDLAQATVFAEASGLAPKALAAQVNGQMAEAANTAKAYPRVKSRSGATFTHPNYGKNGRIDSWRMRSELVLESGDTEALSELLGKLQEKLGVANVQFLPKPDTRKSAEDQAIQAAIAAFQARAQLVAKTMGKSYKIKQMSINSAAQGRPPVLQYRKASSILSEAAPMPMEAGESQIQVHINGQIELAD